MSSYDYEKKYLKYKIKYLEMKNNIKGGTNETENEIDNVYKEIYGSSVQPEYGELRDKLMTFATNPATYNIKIVKNNVTMYEGNLINVTENNIKEKTNEAGASLCMRIEIGYPTIWEKIRHMKKNIIFEHFQGDHKQFAHSIFIKRNIELK